MDYVGGEGRRLPDFYRCGRSAGRGAGVRLAVTGRVPIRVRDQVLAEYRDALALRSRAHTAFLVCDGRLRQRVPYGYLVEPHQWGWTGPTGRAVIAPPHVWSIDPDAAQAIDAMVCWSLLGYADAWIAERLNATYSYPRPLGPSGRIRPFTAALIERVLTDPTWTGHQTWGRTRTGRPQDRDRWITSHRPSHPALIDRWTAERLHERRRTGTGTGTEGSFRTRR